MWIYIIGIVLFAVLLVLAIVLLKRQPEQDTPQDEQLSRELLKKVRQIEISTRSVVNEVFSGEYHSVFKGRGMEFAEVREYMPGDDVRQID